MIVFVPLHFSWFTEKVNTEIIQCLIEEFYSGSNFIKVLKKMKVLVIKDILDQII